MRIHFDDHAGFQRAVLHAAVACSALAAVATLAGSDRLRPGVAVLGAAIATLALALGHLRLVLDPVVDALARAATSADADADGRHLLARAANARARIAPARTGRASDGAAGRALADAADLATVALVELSRRRQALARVLARGAPTGDDLAALEAKRDAAADSLVRDTYARTVRTARERARRATTLACVLERIDARLHGAVAELEGAALENEAHVELAVSDAPATLAATCDRLRSASAELGAACEAHAELAAL